MWSPTNHVDVVSSADETKTVISVKLLQLTGFSLHCYYSWFSRNQQINDPSRESNERTVYCLKHVQGLGLRKAIKIYV